MLSITIYACLCLLALMEISIGLGMSTKDMYIDFWREQNILGRICSNIFYAPAWLVNLLKVAFMFCFYWLVWAIRYISHLSIKYILKPCYISLKKGEF